MPTAPPPANGVRERPQVPSSAITSFIELESLQDLLAPWLPDPADQAFVARCILREGPAHHRGANYVILRLLGQLLARNPRLPRAGDPAADMAIPIRLPPTVPTAHDDREYPLRFPRRVLERLAPPGSATLDAMVDCVSDGPPQHALANAAMLCLLDALLAGDVEAE